MKANAVPLLAIFEKKMRLEVPLFQRQYVWNLEHQWQPLWEDISRKFSEYLEGRKDAPVHFLGAMVLDQKQVPTTHVEKRQVIDGQQRLTTFQLFLASFRDFCKENDCEELAKECDAFTLNKGMMADAAMDRFKVWPTQADREQFADVLLAGSKTKLEEKHPLVRQKWARDYDPRPRMVEAYLYFYRQLTDYFCSEKSALPVPFDTPLSACLDESFQALKNALQVVVIDLEPGDDAQVIFETLNARGEPLLPADLLRNYIFLRAARLGEPQESLYEEFWRKFDDAFWQEETRQGRLSRPRSDLFMQHFLASRQMRDVPVRHLYVEYKFWIEKKHPFTSVRSELEALARQRDNYRRLIAPQNGDLLFGLASFLNSFDMSTAYPVLLFLLDTDIATPDLEMVGVMLESYIVRRAVCGLTTKNYTRNMLGLIRAMDGQVASAQQVHKYLSELKGDSAEWPNDQAFRTAWKNSNAFQTLNNPKMVFVMKRLSDSYFSPKNEVISIDSRLTVEHIMPQSWVEFWPLQDGTTGLTQEELANGKSGDTRYEATITRNAAIQTFGNLTILTQALNSSVSNGPWKDKRPEIMKASLLPINQQLHSATDWDETSIENRSNDLFERAAKIWPSAL